MTTNRFVRIVALVTGWSLAATTVPARADDATGASGSSPAAATAIAPAKIDPSRLIVVDGQLKSQPFQVFVTHQVTKAMNPTLYLAGMHLITTPGRIEGPLTPLRVFPGQSRIINVDGIPVAAEGTLLVFDLSRYKLDLFKSAARFSPSLEWSESSTAAGGPPVRRFLAAEEPIYLGHMPGAALWTIITVGIVVLALLHWSASKGPEIHRFPPRPTLLLITGPDGYLSLWRTQLLLWTFAVGSVVFLFGLLRLHVPEIPETLVALMGMSLLTGTVSAISARSSPAKVRPPVPGAVLPAVAAAPGVVPAAAAVPAAAPVVPAVPAAVPVVPAAPVVAATPAIAFNPGPAALADLISTWNKTTGQVELSVPKAQMVFWTVLILVLFVVKSILLGSLWPVPWEMVALTGFSQAGYIGDKFVQSSTN